LSADEAIDVPLAVVTVTSTAPPDPAGEVATHVVVVEQLTEVPGTPPKEAVVDPTTNPDPVMVTTVPPVTGPVTGVIPVMLGARTMTWVATAEVPPLLETVCPV